MNYPAQSNIWQIEQALGVGRKAEPTDQSRILAKFFQTFPLTLFPDKLVIEELRIVWVHKDGPWDQEIISIMATDIASIDASAGPFFGRVLIKSLTGGPEIMIDNLHRGDVFRIRCLVEGIALSSRAGLQITKGDLEIERDSLLRVGAVGLN